MRNDNVAFDEKNKSQQREPRFVVKVDFGGNDPYYLTSAQVIGLSGANVTDNCIERISGVSQKLNPDKANAEIGSLSFDLLDMGLTTLQKEKLDDEDKGLKGKTVQFYVGWVDLHWDSFVLVQTQIIDEVSYKDRVYKFRCADVQRALREKIFKAKETRLAQDLEPDAEEMVVFTTDSFSPVQHPIVLGSEFSGQKVGLLRVENDDDEFELIGYTGTTANTFTGLIRGCFGTPKLAISRSSDSDRDSSPKVTEVIYMEMPGPMAAYAVLTGSVYGYPGEYLPDHWHLGITANFVRTSDFINIGEDLWDPEDSSKGVVMRLLSLEEEDGKKFIEEQLLLAMGCYPPIYPDGQIGLKRSTPIYGTGGYERRLDESNIVDYGDLTHSMQDVINQIFVYWNWDVYKEEYTRTHLLVDEDSIERHGKSDPKEIELRALSGSRHSYATIERLMQFLRERYAGPPLRLTLTLTPDQNDLEVGTIVRVDIPHINDYTGSTEDGHLNRNFEIQQVTTDWQTGRVKVTLFGSSQKAGALPPSQSGTALPDEAYVRGTEINETTFPGVVTKSGGVLFLDGTLDLTGGENLGDDSSYYWVDGDLTCSDTSEILISDNVALLVRGFFTLNNAVINGKGRGFPGGVGTTSMKVGGYFFEYGSRWGESNKGIPGFIDIQSTPQGGRGYQNRGGLDPILRDVDGVATMRDEGAITGGRIQPGQTPPPIYEQDEEGITIFPVDLRGSSGSGGGSTLSLYDGSLVEYEKPGGDGGAGGAGLMIVARGMSIGTSGKIDVSGAAGSTPPGSDYSPTADPQLHIWAGSGGPGGPGACYILIDGTGNQPPTINERNAIASGGDLVWAGRRLKGYKVTNSGTVTLSSDKGPAPQQGTATTSPAPGAMVWETAFSIQILTGFVAPVPDEPVNTENPVSVTLVEATDTPKSARGNLSTIEVGVEPPGASNYAYGIVEYRVFGDTGWFDAGPASPEGTFVVPSDGSTYEVRVRGVSTRGVVNPQGTTAQITTTKIRAPGEPGNEDTPETPPEEVVPAPPVTGLELYQQGNDPVFGGRDAKFVWRKTSITEWFEMGAEGIQGAGSGGLDLYFKDYQVEVWAEVDGVGQLVRTEWVVDPQFVYTYEKNAEDYARETQTTGAWRAFELRVYCRGRQGQISKEMEALSVENVAPALPEAITISAGFRTAQIDFDPPEDLDYKDSRVWLSQTTGFTPSPENQVAQQYGGPIVLSGLTDGSTYYLRFATYDAFGQGTISSQFTVTTPSLAVDDVDGLGPWASVTDADRDFIEENLAENSIEGTKIVKLTASKIVTGTLAATEKISVEGQVESVVGDAVATLGPKAVNGKTGMITYQYNGNTLFAVHSDGSATFSGAVTITGGSGYSNLTDKPGSLGDINSGEAATLTQAAADSQQALSDAAAAQSTADGKITSYYQDEPPLDAEEGDLWFDTNDGDHPYRWDEEDEGWIDVQDSDIAAALGAASDAQATADGKITTYFSITEPTPEAVGDLWFSDATKLLKRWNGTFWTVSGSDGADWASNLFNIPSRLGDTPSTGLNLTATHLGYYDGTDWRAYIQDDGSLYLGDGDKRFISFDLDNFVVGPDVEVQGVAGYSTQDFSRGGYYHRADEWDSFQDNATVTFYEGTSSLYRGTVELRINSGAAFGNANVEPLQGSFELGSDIVDWGKPCFLDVRLQRTSFDSTAQAFVGRGLWDPNDSAGLWAGFVLKSDGLYGTVANDNGITELQLSSVTGNSSYTLGMRQYTDRVEFFIDGIYEGDITTNIPAPTQTSQSRNVPFMAIVNPAASASQRSRITVGEYRYLIKAS